MNFQKTYLSRQVTRAMAIEYPIGDPTGGAAYGKKEDPISAVMAAVSIYSGVTAVAAGSMILGGLAIAGGALSLVGNVTGNSTLMKIGGVVGLVGSAGLALDKMGAFDKLSSFASEAKDSVAGALGQSGATGAALPANTVADTVNTGAGNFGSVVDMGDNVVAPNFSVSAAGAGASNVTAPLAGSAVNIGPNMGQVNAIGEAGGGGALAGTPSVAGAPAGVGTSMTQVGLEAPSVAPNMGQINPMTDVSAAIQSPGLADTSLGNAAPGIDFAKLPPAGGPGVSIPGATGAGTGSSTGLIGSVLKGIKDNPEAAKLGGAVLQGGLDVLTGKTGAQLDQLKADAAYRQSLADQTARAIEIEQERRARLNAGYTQVNQGIAVNPAGMTNRQVALPTAAPSQQQLPQAPQQFTPLPAQGIINQARTPV